MKLIIHWNKFKRMWTMHTYKSCTYAKNILILGEWRTEVKPNRKSNPRGWVVTEHDNVIVDPGPSLVRQFQKVSQLIYDKKNVCFNINEGDYLLFDEEGCFVVRPIKKYSEKVLTNQQK